MKRTGKIEISGAATDVAPLIRFQLTLPKR